MKKLIFLLLLLPALVNAQSWQPSGARTPYRSVTNGASFLGKGAGTIESPLQWDVAISQPDTSLWQFVNSGSDGKYRLMKNRDIYLGQPAGTVYAQLVYGVTDSLIATQNWATNNLRPYKVYTVLLNQTNTKAPVATILENTLGVTPTWHYEGYGQYRVTSTGLFLANKTFIATNYGIASEDFGNYYSLVRDNDNELLMVVSTGDDRLINTPIEIRIYN